MKYLKTYEGFELSDSLELLFKDSLAQIEDHGGYVKFTQGNFWITNAGLPPMSIHQMQLVVQCSFELKDMVVSSLESIFNRTEDEITLIGGVIGFGGYSYNIQDDPQRIFELIEKEAARDPNVFSYEFPTRIILNLHFKYKD